jgi:hypothetical protein
MNRKITRQIARVRHLAGVLPAVGLVLGAANFATAATLPYSQDFQGIPVGGSVPDFTTNAIGASSSTWGVVDDAGNHVYRNVLTGGKGFSTIQFPTLGLAVPTNDFEISAVVHGVSLSSPTTVNYTAGIAFLSSSTQPSGPSDLFVADLNLSSVASGTNSGRMRLVKWTGTTAVVYPSATQTLQPQVPNFNLSKSYLLDVKGTYDTLGTLTAVFTASEVGAPTNTMSYTYTDTTPRTGSHFGLYTSMSSGGGTMTVDFDNFMVAPGPSSTALTSSANPALPGTAVTFTATVTGTGTPTGTVQFKTNGVAFGSAVTLSSGSASSASVSTLPHGNNAITAQYSGDAYFLASTGSLTQTIDTPPKTATHFLGTCMNTPLSIAASTLAGLDYDADGDALSITAVSNASTNGPANNVTFAGGTITYTPRNNYVGADLFTYAVSDGYPGGTVTNSVSVTIHPLPTVSVNSATVCAGSSATLTATTSANSPSYLWSPGGATTASITVSPASTTTYTVTVTDGTTGCVNSGSGTVTVNPLPIITTDTTNQTACAGSQVTWSVVASGAGTITYQWQRDGTNLVEGADNFTGVTSATLTNSVVSAVDDVGATNGYQCVVSLGSCSVNSTEVALTVNPLPTVSVNSTTVCAGGSATLTATTSANSPSYLWSDNETTASITVSPASTTTYTVTVTDGTTGCVNSGSGTVTVNPLPTITLGSGPSVTYGSTSANLPYTATTGSPNQYSIMFDGTAHSSGFADVAMTTLPAGQIGITVPAHASVGTYNGTLVIENSTTGCSSSGTAFTVTVRKANATIVVTPYNVTYDGSAHTASGTATGVLNEALSGLNLSGTTHTAAGSYPNDSWTFTDATGNYNNASGTVADQIGAAQSAIALMSSLNPSTLGATVTFTATVTSASLPTFTPTGSVEFFTNGVDIGGPVPLSGGTATMSTALLPQGSATITAMYLGDGDFSPSADFLVEAVTVETPIMLSVANNGDGTVTVTCEGTPGGQYLVQANDDLASMPWSNISTNIAGTNGLWTLTESVTNHVQWFFRSAKP